MSGNCFDEPGHNDPGGDIDPLDLAVHTIHELEADIAELESDNAEQHIAIGNLTEDNNAKHKQILALQAEIARLKESLNGKA